ncbi:hypothetical protein ASD11_11555 [Aeromicrobium sp. Root495]|uniref:hypothetical protein n=1 Tax=Aeromicrobium sp. Root495 TaxID=1736550 RepID=UPI0006F732D2|nr:hypothetical protein [Aeromicrobium sp. Root495]KQY60121.1 hypothetical protein ASD11_11555 [Aeromicrobium sp. Root495]
MTRALPRSLALAVASAGLSLGLAAPASASPTDDVKTALGAGDGPRAARLIASSGFATQPAVLADLIYGGGVIAVRDGHDEAFTEAVAVAFVDGGVSPATAQLAFADAATLVASNAANDPQILQELAPGGVAILRTELRYAGVSLPALGLDALDLPRLPLPLQLF